MSTPAPAVRPNSGTDQVVALNNAARLPIFATEDKTRIGFGIRNPIGSGQTVFIALGPGVVLTDANAPYALGPGDLLTDTVTPGYCGPIYASATGPVSVIVETLK